MNTKNLDAAAKAIAAEQGAEVAAEDLPAYIAQIDELIAAARALKTPHKKWIAAEASRRMRARKADELAAMQARLAELEASAKK
jgi:hypothetical protein